MMRAINRFKRIIAGILSFIIIVTIIPDLSVYAEAEEFSDIEKAQIDSQADDEIAQESIYDMMHGNNGSEWWRAVHVDLLSWNSFHNAVQQHIRANNEGFLNKELYLEYVDQETNKKKKGRADLSVEDGKYTYIWEVKPYSYREGDKREEAENQLSNYVSAEEEYDYGDMRIPNGTTYVNTTRFYPTYMEEIKYTITYVVEKNINMYKAQ